MKKDTQNTLSPVTITLHWIVGLTMMSLIAVGIYMTENDAYSLYPIHKAVGFLIFFVIALRVLWRIKNGWPTPVREYAVVEHKLAKLVHWTLIIGTVLMPISGFLMSSLGGYGVDVFGWELVAKNPNPVNPQEMLPHNAAIAGFAHQIHHWVGELLIVAIVLHIVGALKHHIFDKDGTLRRMLGASV